MHESTKRKLYLCPPELNWQNTELNFDIPEPSIFTSIPPDLYEAAGAKDPSSVQLALSKGSSGSKQFPQRSTTFFPFGILAQSRHVELSPPQTPQSSSPVTYKKFLNCKSF